MIHSFDIEHAKKYGVDGAIILHNIYFWLEKNKANNKHFYDGRFWTYNSINAFTELFPYWSEKQIRRILSSLEDGGILIVGNFNKSNYDRTKWYSLDLNIKFQKTPEAKQNSTCPNGQMDLTKRANGFDQTGEPIPDSKPYSKPYNISFDDFWNLYDKKVSRDKCYKKWNKLSDVDRENIIKYIPMYKKAQPEKKFRKNPETFLNNKSWEDELISENNKPQTPSFDCTGGFDNPKKPTDELEVGDWIVLKHRAGFDYKAKFNGYTEQGRMITKDSYFTPEQLQKIK